MENQLEEVVVEEVSGEEAEAKKEEPKRMRDNLYDRIDVSVKTMNIVIGVLVAVLIIFLAFGIWQANFR